MEVSDILEYLRTKKKFLKEKGIEEVALFGSFSNNTDNIYSDIDIAFKKEKDYLQKFSPYDYFETLSELKKDLSMKFSRNIDVFDLDSTSTFLNSIKKDLKYV